MAGQREHFDTIAHAYDGSIPAHVQDHYLDKRMRFLSPLFGEGDWVCSVGAGTGSLERALAGPGERLVLVDQSEAMCRLARGKGLPHVVCADAAHLPLKTAMAGLAYSVAAFHHLIRPDKVALAVKEMHRIVKPGGTMVIWDHNLRNPYWKIIMAKVPQDTGYERIVPLEEFRRLLTALACRWSVVYSGWVPDFVPRSLLGAAKATEWILERLPGVSGLSAHNIFTVRKT